MSFSTVAPQSLVPLQKKLPNLHSSMNHRLLTFTVSNSMNHGLPHAFWWEHGAQTPAWPQAAAQTMRINMDRGGSMDYRPQHDLLRQHRLQTSAWPQKEALGIPTNTLPSSSTIMEIFDEAQSRKWTTLHLGHPAVAQSQGDCAAGQQVGGRAYSCSHLAGPLHLPRSSPIPVLLLHEFNSSFYSPFSYLYLPSHCPSLTFIISLHIHFHSVIPNILFLRMNLLSLVQLPVSTSKSDRTACQYCLLHSRNKLLLTLLNHTWYDKGQVARF